MAPPQRIPLNLPPSSSENALGKCKVKAILRIRPFLPHEHPSISKSESIRGLKDHSILNCKQQNLIPIITLLSKDNFNNDATNNIEPKRSKGKSNDTFSFLPSLFQIAQIPNPRNPFHESLSFIFDACYGPAQGQLGIFFQQVVPLLERFLEGYNGTIFAYGMTGAGKTHTMEGTEEHPGMIPLSIQYLFEAIKKGGSQNGEKANEIIKRELRISYLEIYKEKVYDLLLLGVGSTASTLSDLPIREDQHKNIVIPDLTSHSIGNLVDFNRLWQRGLANRRTAATKLNAHSSRSHACLIIEFSSLSKSKLHLIDLAGSEDNRKTANTGERLIESGSINKSLFVLGQVVDALNSQDHNLCSTITAETSRIPYRDSKLTRLLQDSLGGKAFSLIIANVAPGSEFLTDTINTLGFAAKARRIENTVRKTKDKEGEGEGEEGTLLAKRQQQQKENDRLAELEIWKRKRTGNDVPVGPSTATKKSIVMVAPTINKVVTTNGNEEALLLEKRIEEKVAEKLRQFSKGTILSPLFKERSVKINGGGIPFGLKNSLISTAKRIKKTKIQTQNKLIMDDKDNPFPSKIKNGLAEGLSEAAQRAIPFVQSDLLHSFNHNSAKEISTLRGIGKKRADSIVALRESLILQIQQQNQQQQQQHSSQLVALNRLEQLAEYGIMGWKVLGKIITTNALGKPGYILTKDDNAKEPFYEENANDSPNYLKKSIEPICLPQLETTKVSSSLSMVNENKRLSFEIPSIPTNYSDDDDFGFYSKEQKKNSSPETKIVNDNYENDSSNDISPPTSPFIISIVHGGKSPQRSKLKNSFLCSTDDE